MRETSGGVMEEGVVFVGVVRYGGPNDVLLLVSTESL